LNCICAERAGKIYRRLVLYRFAGCWLRQLNQQQMERALTKRADRFRSGWLLASGLHRWRLLSRRLWAREHQIDVEQAGWLVRSNWNQWLRLYRQRAEQTGKSIALRFANQQKRLKHGLHEWLNQAQLLIIMNGSAVESHRLAALRFAFGLWRQSSAAHRADRQYQTKLRKIAFSHWQTVSANFTFSRNC
jgi:hypothetical protein